MPFKRLPWREAISVIVALIVMLSVLGGCGGGKGGSKSKKGGELTLGSKVEAVERSISPAGGTITVEKPGDPLNGLQIEVPADAYPDSRTFEVSYSPVEEHSFGTDFNPISPLITIENGGGYSDEVMTAKIPVSVPGGHFAMAFYYDDKTGELEGVPLISSEGNFVTVATRHFSKLVVSSVAEYVLTGEIDSDFKPGVDDWQFTNYGSYIAPGGHCAGQSITNIWYYYEKKLGGAPALYGRYDNNGGKKTPNLWEDDSLGYRLASTIQQDIDWESLSAKFFLKYYSNVVDDELTWKAFAYSMLITGNPQLVGIQNTTVGGGHAMVVYKVTNGTLHVADPNYPGNLDRKIEFVDGKFKPYSSGANAQAIAQGKGKAYDRIVYVAVSGLVDWGQIASRWGEFESKTIGNDRFPGYTLQVIENSGVTYELADGFNTDGKLLRIAASSGTTLGVNVYRDGVPLQYDDKYRYELKPGNNLLGILVQGEAGGGWQWVDFKYVNVKYEPPETEIPKAHGHPVVENISGPAIIEGPGPYTFSVQVSGGEPPYYYEWRGVHAPATDAEGLDLAEVSLLRDQLRWNGEGYWVFISVKDSKGEYAQWVDEVGMAKWEFTYGVRWVPPEGDGKGYWAVITQPSSFPYKTPGG